jgi:pSer/pThr/pTyr-binding forkhead associated (FHA) protein/S1-C subfamily serine protease
MADKPNIQIIIRHIAGAKINRIDPFALADTKEITFGRQAGSTITFDSPKDDVVSRRHAVLRVRSNGSLSFAIEDFNSSNGTFVNGERISGEVELLPEDTVEFGKGGPKFIFDVQPRPDNMAARTRVMSAIESTATRAVATTALNDTVQQTAQMPTAPVKTGVGKNTVMMMLTNERKKSGQRWMGIMAAAIAFLLVVGGIVVWQVRQESEQQVAKATSQAQAATQQITNVTQQMGLSPGDVVSKFGNSTVWLDVQWRLYDKETGRPVYHKAWIGNDGNRKVKLPAYLKYGEDIYPWLTTNDEEHENYEVRGALSGSGFVVNAQGFILTNRHLGASWKESVDPSDYLSNNPSNRAFLLTKTRKCATVQAVDIKSLKLKTWVPEDDGGFLFPSDSGSARCLDLPKIAQKESIKPFFGKNEVLTVRFPHSRLSINADLVRTSTDEDIALLKVNSPEPLVPLTLATDDSVKVGEKVMSLGYPGLSMRTYMTIENDRTGKSRQEVIPEPTVQDGIVQKLGMRTTQEGTRRIESNQGDTLQVSLQAAPGSSGGPVFNSDGKVIGVIAYRRQAHGFSSTFAVRIRHGRNLLAPQQMMIQ